MTVPRKLGELSPLLYVLSVRSGSSNYTRLPAQSAALIPRSGNVQQARGLERKEPVPLFASSDGFSARDCASHARPRHC